MDLASPRRFSWTESSLGLDSASGALRCSETLSSSQQRALFRELRRPGTSARKRDLLRARLVVGTLPIVLHCLQRVADRQRFSELVQEGLLALLHAVDLFATRNRNDFTRFAAVRVARWLRGIQRRWARERAVLVDTPIEDLGDHEISDPFSVTSQTESEERLEMMVSHLPEIQQRVLRLRFGIGVREAQSREVISRELRLEQQRVRYLEERALLTLRRSVERQRARDWAV
jgi:RNA polymerase sigma factor (sigma-70 family)